MESREVAAHYADRTHQGEFRDAYDDTYFVAGEEMWPEAQLAIEECLFRGIERAESPEEVDHSIKKSTPEVLAEEDGEVLLDTPFIDYVVGLEALTERFNEQLPEDGERGPVRTNERITKMTHFAKTPQDFFRKSLDFVAARRQRHFDNVGPENLATIAHYYLNLHKDHETTPVEDELEGLVPEWEQWLFDSLRNDKLNVIELGNIYKSIRHFKEYLSDEFYDMLFQNTVNRLDNFTELTNSHMYQAIAAMPEEKLHQGWVLIFQIEQKKQPVYNRTLDYRDSLAALAGLPPQTVPYENYIHVLEKGREVGNMQQPSELLFCAHKMMSIAERCGGDQETYSLMYKASKNYIRKAANLAKQDPQEESRKATYEEVRKAFGRHKSL